VAELSLSLPDDLVQELRATAPDDVSAFVAAAVRHALDQWRLHAFVEELVTELGPSDEAEVAGYSELFASAAVAEAGRKHRRDGAWDGPTQSFCRHELAPGGITWLRRNSSGPSVRCSIPREGREGKSEAADFRERRRVGVTGLPITC
jgi:hypothetical protein